MFQDFFEELGVVATGGFEDEFLGRCALYM
jgi:hypothetical protein